MTTIDDDLEAIFLRPRQPPRSRAEPTVDTPQVTDTLGAKLEALLEDTKAGDSASVHLPTVLDLTHLLVRGDERPVVLLGFHAVCRRTWLSHARLPRVRGHDAYGGGVDIDGDDLLDRRDRWVVGADGHRACLVCYATAADVVSTTFAVALLATDGMTIRRYVVGRDGDVVAGSTETWLVEGGQVLRTRPSQ